MPSALSDLPAEAGAYALIITLNRPIAFAAGTLGAAALPTGRYVYAGSARGPGGIRSRVARHVKTEKLPLWHVDHLTIAASAIHPIAFVGGHECAIVAALTESGGFEAPVPGLGSSDCRACRSHLLSAPSPTDAVRALYLLRRRLTQPLGD